MASGKPAAVDARILDELYAVIESRKGAAPESSYTAKLFDGGAAKIAQKVGEDAVETLIEAMRGDKERLAADNPRWGLSWCRKAGSSCCRSLGDTSRN